MTLFFLPTMKFGDGGGQPNMLKSSTKLLMIQVKCGSNNKMDQSAMLLTQISTLIKIMDMSWLPKSDQRELELINHSQKKRESGSLTQKIKLSPQMWMVSNLNFHLRDNQEILHTLNWLHHLSCKVKTKTDQNGILNTATTKTMDLTDKNTTTCFQENHTALMKLKLDLLVINESQNDLILLFKTI